MHRMSRAFCSFVALGVLLLAGCSSGSSGSAAVPAGASTSSSSSGATGSGTDPTATTTAGSGAGPTCKQLTFADVQPVFTHKIATVKVTAEGTGQQCVFSGADGAGAIDVLVLGGSLAQQGWSEALTGQSDGAVSVPGIGDKAVRDKGDDQIDSIKGDTYCAVSLGSGEDVPGIGRLEAAAGGTTHIPESANAAAALALGTLCNRIYGSGNTTPDLSALTG